MIAKLYAHPTSRLSRSRQPASPSDETPTPLDPADYALAEWELFQADARTTIETANDLANQTQEILRQYRSKSILTAREAKVVLIAREQYHICVSIIRDISVEAGLPFHPEMYALESGRC